MNVAFDEGKVCNDDAGQDEDQNIANIANGFPQRMQDVQRFR
jgi:hypothetical protein